MTNSARPVQLGLTGNIGSGKSTVARLFAARGAAVIDADAIARDATRDPEVLRRIAAKLGSDLVRGGELDRGATAARVFGDDDARATLNAIIHPWVRARSLRLQQEIAARPSPPPVVVHDIPLLYENGLEQGLDAVVVVDADLETRVRRVTERSGLERAEVLRRDAAQWPLERKTERATYVIHNDGEPHALEAQIDVIWSDLLRSRTAHAPSEG